MMRFSVWVIASIVLTTLLVSLGLAVGLSYRDPRAWGPPPGGAAASPAWAPRPQGAPAARQTTSPERGLCAITRLQKGVEHVLAAAGGGSCYFNDLRDGRLKCVQETGDYHIIVAAYALVRPPARPESHGGAPPYVRFFKDAYRDEGERDRVLDSVTPNVSTVPCWYDGLGAGDFSLMKSAVAKTD
jgi:hypothetical protein